MKHEIEDSISRMTKDDLQDVAITFKLEKATKSYIKKMAFADEDIAEYVLMY